MKSVMIIVITFALLIPVSTFALSNSERTWDPGEGMKTGDYYEYSVCSDCIDESILRIWIGNEGEHFWNVEIELVDIVDPKFFKK